MLLVEATINSTLYRLSMEGIPLTYYWDNKIISFDPPQYQISNLFGGYVRPGFGDIAFAHSLFDDEWPPPVNIDITIYYTATTEAVKETLFTGKAHLKSITRERIIYDLFGPSYTAEMVYNQLYQIGAMGSDRYEIGGTGEDTIRIGPSDPVSFDDTLVDVVTWFCGGAVLNLTVDTTYARSPSPGVKFTMTQDKIAINLLSDICAFFTHLFYISGSTLYLIDMLADAGSDTITEFEFFPSEYHYNVPISLVRTSNYSRTSDYPYGNEISLSTEFINTEAGNNVALDNIITVMNKPTCSLKMPLLGSIPTPGKKLSWTDTSLGQDMDAYIRARTIIFDFNREEVIIKGEGVLSES